MFFFFLYTKFVATVILLKFVNWFVAFSCVVAVFSFHSINSSADCYHSATGHSNIVLVCFRLHHLK
jgi:hypothetical protein